MKTFIAILSLSLGICGCGIIGRTSYVEGLSIQAGVYLPVEGGNTYGLQLCQYVSGIKLSTSTNTNLKIVRSANVNNNFLFGLISNSETNKTQIVIEKEDMYTIDDVK